MSTPYGSNEKFGQHAPSPKKGLSKWIKIGVPVAILVIVGAVVGGVVGSRAAKNNSASSTSQNDNAGGSSSSSASRVTGAGTGAGTGSATGGGRSSTASATSSSVSASATPVAGAYAVTPLPAWNWAENKAVGMCLGSWLLLERWMLEDWFIANAGADSWDEWDFSETLGSRTQEVLEEHWNNWITESDVQQMYEAGINHLRIPTGFWAWIPTVDGEPYLNNQTAYQAQLDRILSYAHARGIYAIIDLHGLPGSQNGEQASGHNTTTPNFFNNPTNQGRSDATVKAVMSYIENSPFRTVITGLEVINEPRPYTDSQLAELEAYYDRSYATIQASSWPITMIIAEGYQKTGIETWRNWATAHATDPPSAIMAEHPYPGNFPPQTNAQDILGQVCTAANKYVNYPIPVLITEAGVYTGIKTSAFEKTFYESQLAAWAWSAGSMYWSWRHQPSQMQLQAGLDYSQYSFVTLLNNATDTIPKPSDFGITNTTTKANTDAYLAALTSNCGAAPANAAPYPAASQSWDVRNAAESSVVSLQLTATSISDVAQETQQARRRNRMKRSFSG